MWRKFTEKEKVMFTLLVRILLPFMAWRLLSFVKRILCSPLTVRVCIIIRKRQKTIFKVGKGGMYRRT